MFLYLSSRFVPKKLFNTREKTKYIDKWGFFLLEKCPSSVNLDSKECGGDQMGWWYPWKIIDSIKHHMDIRDYCTIINILKKMNAQIGDIFPPKACLLLYGHNIHLLHSASTLCCDFPCIPLGMPYFKTTITQCHVAADSWLPPFLYLEV